MDVLKRIDRKGGDLQSKESHQVAYSKAMRMEHAMVLLTTELTAETLVSTLTRLSMRTRIIRKVSERVRMPFLGVGSELQNGLHLLYVRVDETYDSTLL